MRAVKRILDLGRSEAQQETEPLYAYDHKPGQAKWSFIWLAVVFALCFIASCAISNPAHAAVIQRTRGYSEIPVELAISTIVGEASNQGLIGMTAVAEVIRHKGSLRGFYGLHAKHSAHEPKWVWLQAKKAWYASKTSRYTKYADHFENIHAFGCPYWVKNCIETFRYRDHIFYKEVV